MEFLLRVWIRHICILACGKQHLHGTPKTWISTVLIIYISGSQSHGKFNFLLSIICLFVQLSKPNSWGTVALQWWALLKSQNNILSWKSNEIREVCDIKNIAVMYYILKEKASKYIGLISVHQKNIVMIQFEKLN